MLIRVPVDQGVPAALPSVSQKSHGALLKAAGRRRASRAASSSSDRRSGKELAEYGALALIVVHRHRALPGLRFEWSFALSAIIANLHDVVIILGFFALFQWEFSLPVLAAVLAVLGYSVNESVVDLRPDPRELPQNAQGRRCRR